MAAAAPAAPIPLGPVNNPPNVNNAAPAQPNAGQAQVQPAPAQVVPPPPAPGGLAAIGQHNMHQPSRAGRNCFDRPFVAIGFVAMLAFGMVQTLMGVSQTRNTAVQTCLNLMAIGQYSDSCNKTVASGVTRSPLVRRNLFSSVQGSATDIALDVAGTVAITVAVGFLTMIWFRPKMDVFHPVISLARYCYGIAIHAVLPNTGADANQLLLDSGDQIGIYYESDGEEEGLSDSESLDVQPNLIELDHVGSEDDQPLEDADESDTDDKWPGSVRSSSPSIDDEDIDFEFVYALHTFVATVEGQANVTKGDTMVLLDDSNSYWWLVRVVKDNTIGYLPAEHIETPTERLARLNKHRNIELSATMLSDGLGHRGDVLSRALKRMKSKTIRFTEPIYIDDSPYEYDSEEEVDDGSEEHTALQTLRQAECDNEDLARADHEDHVAAVSDERIIRKKFVDLGLLKPDEDRTSSPSSLPTWNRNVSQPGESLCAPTPCPSSAEDGGYLTSLIRC